MESANSIEQTTTLQFDNSTEAEEKLGVDISHMYDNALQQASTAGHPVNPANPHEVWVKIESNGNATVVITQSVGSQANGGS